MKDRIRLGLLGCSTVSTYAVLAPAAEGADIEVTAIAGRDPVRTAAFAAQHGIEQHFPDYAALLAGAGIDAVYIGLPNNLHGRWTKAALAAGFPVLCEKPMAANAEEAEEMVLAAEAAGLPLVEAIHWSDHPIAGRIKAILAELGPLQAMDMHYCLPGDMLPRDNIRFAPDLAGGWLMDQGSYCISFARHFAGEPEAVASARADEARPGLDGGMEAELRFPGGVTCRIGGSMIDLSVKEVILSARFECEDGTLSIADPYLPGANPFTAEQGARLVIERKDGTRREERADLISSWFCQANRFADIVRSWTGGPVPARDAIANMRVVDAIYRKAGMEPRKPAT